MVGGKAPPEQGLVELERNHDLIVDGCWVWNLQPDSELFCFAPREQGTSAS